MERWQVSVNASKGVDVGRAARIAALPQADRPGVYRHGSDARLGGVRGRADVCPGRCCETAGVGQYGHLMPELPELEALAAGLTSAILAPMPDAVTTRVK